MSPWAFLFRLPHGWKLTGTSSTWGRNRTRYGHFGKQRRTFLRSEAYTPVQSFMPLQYIHKKHENMAYHINTCTEGPEGDCWARTPAIKPDLLSLIPQTHVVEGENRPRQALLWSSHTCSDTCVFPSPPKHAQNNKNVAKNLKKIPCSFIHNKPKLETQPVVNGQTLCSDPHKGCTGLQW